MSSAVSEMAAQCCTISIIKNGGGSVFEKTGKKLSSAVMKNSANLQSQSHSLHGSAKLL